jgi:hypothetical protein
VRRLVLDTITVILGAALVVGILTNLGRQDKLCQVVRGTVASSDATLGKPGSPGYAYYKVHPTELKAAHKQARELLKQLDYCGIPKQHPAPVKRKPKPRAHQRAAHQAAALSKRPGSGLGKRPAPAPDRSESTPRHPRHPHHPKLPQTAAPQQPATPSPSPAQPAPPRIVCLPAIDSVVPQTCI